MLLPGATQKRNFQHKLFKGTSYWVIYSFIPKFPVTFRTRTSQISRVKHNNYLLPITNSCRKKCMEMSRLQSQRFQACKRKKLRFQLTWVDFSRTCRLASIRQDSHNQVPQNKQSAQTKRSMKNCVTASRQIKAFYLWEL